MKASEFVAKCFLALQNPSQYATGGFGAPTGYANNTERYAKNSSAKIAKKILACHAGTFLFDCVCMGKGILWGWKADPNMRYGGAVYNSNGVKDFVSSDLEKYCTSWGVDIDPAKIAPGEWLLHFPGGHCRHS